MNDAARPMHICYLARGSFMHLPAYIEFFSRRGHRVSLIHLDPHPVSGAENFSAAAGTFDPTKGKWKLPLHFPKVLWHVWKLRPDIVHAHYATSAGFLGALSGFEPLVVSCHGTDVLFGDRGGFRRAALRVAFTRARIIHVVSDQMRERVLSLGAPRERVLVSNVGVVTETLRAPRAPRPGGRVEIVCTRRLEPIYDVGTLLRALALLARRGLDFGCTIAGGGSLEISLRAQAQTFGLGSRVRFLRGFDPRELPALLASADVYVSASLSDGASLSLLEGMGGGLFPVATDIPSNREWITSGENGLLFHPGDEEALAAALATACAERHRWAPAAKRNLEIVRQRGDRERNLELMEELYRKLIAAGSL